MHESYLNVVGTDAILQAIVRCWESARSHRALEYRRQRGLSLGNVQLAVLVQLLIVSDVSIVAFSMNPVTLNRAEVMINASWGLGESLVSGTVTPDTFVVRKSDLEVTSQTIADKGRMTVAVPGGTREVDVPHFLRSEACLSKEQLIEVAQLVLSLEATMGYPVDIECTCAGRKLYLLQCRPVTARK
jgi:phosphoenolpyruvate synthase/pyruvate phosphate dikinase